MNNQTAYLDTPDHYKIPLRIWQSSTKGKPKGVLHLSHGMAEHSGRYETFAKALNRSGFHVVAHDHRGHGESIGDCAGYYSKQNGWDLVTSDIGLVHQFIDQEFPSLPKFAFGHSMGSFILMGYLMRNPDSRLSGIILSGSNYSPPSKYKALQPILKAEKIRLGAQGRSPVIKMLTFGSFNNKFKPSRTEYDWLSRDPAEVDKYIADEQCGFFSTIQLWEDLTAGLSEISRPKSFQKIPSQVPLYLFAGDQDPVGGHGKGVSQLAGRFIFSGHQDVTIRLYHEGRHEMLNETNSKQVIAELIHWLNLKIK
ncbi:MAG: lysophospholipase [Pseudomonadales bacterium]|nr:lysophospholipase [Pseudomonadales bacterium]